MHFALKPTDIQGSQITNSQPGFNCNLEKLLVHLQHSQHETINNKVMEFSIPAFLWNNFPCIITNNDCTGHSFINIYGV